MREKLIIIGASGHGKVVADIAEKMNEWKQIVFLDDNESKKKCLKYDVIGRTDISFKYLDEADFFVAIGNNAIREKVQENLRNEGAYIATLIHPTTTIGYDVIIGNGTVIMAGVVINSSTVIGNGCIVNTSSSIDHDNKIDDYVHISPGVNLAGTVSIDKGNWIGIGASVSNNITICAGCRIGAGSVVIKNIDEVGTYVGTPARRIR